MKSLYDLQKLFAAELWREEAPEPGGTIVDDEFPAQRRLNIYRNNFKTNLRTALAATYPVTKKLVGSEFFRLLAEKYIGAHPPQSGDLRHFCLYLPEFLLDFEAAKTLPYLADVARLEWACSAVSVAPSPIFCVPGDFETLDPVDITNLRFVARKGSRLVHSKFPIFSIWSVNQETHLGDKPVSLDEGAQSVLVVRPNLELELWSLDDAESVFAEALIAGKTLGEAVEAVTLRGHDVELKTLFGKYLRSGALTFSHFENQSRSETEYRHDGR